MLRIYFRTLFVCWKTFGFSKIFLSCLFVNGLVHIFTTITLFLDQIFVFNYKKVSVNNPIFIIGHPRSGTTLTHRLLSKTEDAVIFQLWHILFPAITARILLKPLMTYLIDNGNDEYMPAWTGHEMRLGRLEEEEMLFSHIWDTQLIAVGILGFDELEYPELEYQDLQSKQQRLKSIQFLHGCFQRHIYYTGKSQIIAQTHFSTNRIKTLMEFYPDAKFIYQVRNPHQVIPSFLSLLHNGMEFHWGLSKIPAPILHRYNERRYQASVNLYQYFYQLEQNGELPADTVKVLPYKLLRDDLEQAFKEMIDFTQIKVSDRIYQEISQLSQKQKNYKPAHKVKKLEDFGLSHDRIDKDLAFVFSEYDV